MTDLDPCSSTRVEGVSHPLGRLNKLYNPNLIRPKTPYDDGFLEVRKPLTPGGGEGLLMRFLAVVHCSPVFQVILEVIPMELEEQIRYDEASL